METGLETLQMDRTASRREARASGYDNEQISDSRFSPSRRERFHSDQDGHDSFDDSAIGPEYDLFDSEFTPTVTAASLFPSTHQQLQTLPSFSITPTVTAASLFPSTHQQLQTLPSFSAAFGMHPSPHLPADMTQTK